MRANDAHLSPEAKNSKWFKEREELTPGVEALVAEHCPRSKPLTADAYRTVATALKVISDRKDAAPFRKDATKAHREKASKYATALLYHLKPIKRKIDGLIADILEPAALQETLAHYNKELEVLVAAAKAVEELLPALDRPPIAPLDDHEPIKSIASVVQEVLAEANDGDAPTGKGEENPLVKLIVDLFGLVKIGYSPSTVSAVLRDRRRIKKVGRKREPKMSCERD